MPFVKLNAALLLLAVGASLGATATKVDALPVDFEPEVDTAKAARDLSEAEDRELRGYYYAPWYAGYYSGAWYGYGAGYGAWYSNFYDYYSGWYANFYDAWYANVYGGWYSDVYSGWYSDLYGWYSNFYGGWYSDFYSGWYYDFYSGWYSDFYYGWYNNFYYSFYNNFYTSFYDYGYGWYNSFYYFGWYDFYYDYFNWYSGWYNSWYYSWYYNSWYSWGYYGNHKIGAVHPYTYYYSNAETFVPGDAGYAYYYWYHYADSTSHWDAKLAMGWSNWADIVQGAAVNLASTFIETWKCHRDNALTNIIAMSQYRKDTCSNGDRRWIFAGGDENQLVIVDLKKKRQISEMGVDFGNANERLPSGVTFKYIPYSDIPFTKKLSFDLFEVFGSVDSDISGYVNVIQPGGVSARFVMYQFEATDELGSAFMQVVAAGPPFDENPSTSYIVLVVILIAGIIAVGILLHILNKGRAAIVRRFYKVSKKQLAKENSEFSSDSDSDSDSDSSSGSDSDSEDGSSDSDYNAKTEV